MTNRRKHSSIDLLPADIRDDVREMIVDNIWPDGWPAGDGHPRYEDVVAYLASKGHDISKSAVGRYGKQLQVLSTMKQAGIITREVMRDVSESNASQTQKAVAEMITAVIIDFVSRQKHATAKDIANVARATKDVTAVAIAADKYTRRQIEEKVLAAADSAKAKLKKLGAKRKQAQEIIDDILGVTR